MGNYFPEEASIHSRLHEDLEGILGTIAGRYMGQHPPAPFVYRAFSRYGILNAKDRRYRIDLNEKFPDARPGQVSYACAKLWSDGTREINLALTCLGPVRICCNGKQVYKSTVKDEIESKHRKTDIAFVLKQGWNIFWITCIKTTAGFGCLVGTSSPKWLPLNFHSPFSLRAGQSGWIYSEPADEDRFTEGNLPEHDEREEITGLVWHPKLDWGPDQAGKTPLGRIFGDEAAGVFFSWTQLKVTHYGRSLCTFTGEALSPFEVWVNNEQAFIQKDAGEFAFTLNLSYGLHDVLVKTTALLPGSCGMTLSAAADGNGCGFALPYPVQGIPGPWLYLGPFPLEFSFHEAKEIQTMHRLFAGKEGKTYWRADAPGVYVRPFLENELYGKWSYPLGVTLYGLLQTGRILQRPDIEGYVARHVEMCAGIHEYALWDQDFYGYPGVNHQLCGMESLDDCGSFGSLMLEASGAAVTPPVSFVADLIADHMSNRQERREEGAFYRCVPDGISENTLWADDLYMSVPFLCRYYQLTGQREYLDDAAKQFLLFKKYLYLPDYGVMSHVYDFKRDTATSIPWGRGNGWVLFSLSEILAVLPEDHEQRQDLLEFYRELSRGYLALQGTHGLWHQVLTHPDAYEETSCTSMFAYAFARGIRYGWVREEEREAYISAVLRAWEGLTRISIDKAGNIHGVCRGSWYSFTAEYYKQDLLWNLNDVHGIGIVMLAGIEVKKLRDHLGAGLWSAKEKF
ncbi:MAG: hypothetical protein K0R57_353 [Paenibacillaceae bacterium]|jgi:rhamnogalacturonyl hydrolase YesR|nr:hypothetical protein [Paenibacillaceae bacterium]